MSLEAAAWAAAASVLARVAYGAGLAARSPEPSAEAPSPELWGAVAEVLDSSAKVISAQKELIESMRREEKAAEEALSAAFPEEERWNDRDEGEDPTEQSAVRRQRESADPEDPPEPELANLCLEMKRKMDEAAAALVESPPRSAEEAKALAESLKMPRPGSSSPERARP